MIVHPMHIFYTCMITYYAIGFVVSFCWGLWARRQKNRDDCNAKYLFNILRIYLIPVITCADFFSDVTIALLWLSDDHTRNMGSVSVFILLLQRVISAFILENGNGWWTGVRQFFDLEVFNFIFLSVKYDRQVYDLQKYKILEGLLESFPQLLIQMYNLHNEEDIGESIWLIEHLSIITSLISLTLCFLFIDVASVVPNKFAYPKLGCICIWRFGDMAMRICVMVTFASLVSAKLGSTFMFMALLVFNMILMTYFTDAKKSTIFYKNRLESNFSNPKTSQTSTSSLLERQTFEEPNFLDKVSHISNKQVEKMDTQLGRLHKGEEVPKLESNLVFMVKNGTHWIISEVGGAYFAILALPSLVPCEFVVFFYLFKLLFEGSLIAACVYQTKGFESINNAIDLIYFLKDEIFSAIWFYWVAGVFCFVFGGTLSFFSINTKQWIDAMEGSGEVTLKLMKAKHYSLVERVVDNGVCTIEKIIQLALKELDDDPKPSGSIDFVKKPYCELLFLMLKQRILLLGPKHKKLRKEAARNAKYRNYVVPALLGRCNESRQTTKEINLAKLIFHKIVQDDKHLSERSWLNKMRNAGASLTFLRFHLGVDIIFFEKGGDFSCEAAELMAEHFDLLFCFQCGFSRKELIECGFEKELVNDPVFDNRHVNLEMLKKFKSKLFAMHFTVKQLKHSNLFKDSELLGYFREYFENVGYSPRNQVTYRVSEYNSSIPSFFSSPSRGTVSMISLRALNKEFVSEYSSADIEASESSLVWKTNSLNSEPQIQNIIPINELVIVE